MHVLCARDSSPEKEERFVPVSPEPQGTITFLPSYWVASPQKEGDGSRQVGQPWASSCPACHLMFPGLPPGGQFQQVNELPSHLLGTSRPDTVAYTGTYPLLTVDSVVQMILPILKTRGQKLRGRSPMWPGDSCAWNPGCDSRHRARIAPLRLRSGFWLRVPVCSLVFRLPAWTSELPQKV